MMLTEKDIGKKFRMRAWAEHYPEEYFVPTTFSPQGRYVIGNLSNGEERAIELNDSSYWAQWEEFGEI